MQSYSSRVFMNTQLAPRFDRTGTHTGQILGSLSAGTDRSIAPVAQDPFQDLSGPSNGAALKQHVARNVQVTQAWHEKVAVIGMGAYGAALSHRLVESGADVVTFGRNRESVEKFHRDRVIPRLSNVQLSSKLSATDNLEEALFDRGTIILAVPSQAIPDVLGRMIPHPDTLVISLAKGLIVEDWNPTEASSFRIGPPAGARVFTPLEYIARHPNWAAATQRVVAAGPGFAGEIARGNRFALTLASEDKSARDRAYYQFGRIKNAYLQTHDDPVGVEIAAAMKNVISVAVGIVEGLRDGDAPRYSSLERTMVKELGVREAISITKHEGGKTKTFLTYAGWADLDLTSSNNASRNRQVGLALADGKHIEEIMGHGAVTAEGVVAAYAIKRRTDPRGAGVKGIYTPLTNHLVDGFQGLAPWDVIMDNLFDKERHHVESESAPHPDIFRIRYFGAESGPYPKN